MDPAAIDPAWYGAAAVLLASVPLTCLLAWAAKKLVALIH